MIYDEEYKLMKERTFNAYMIKSIKNVYFRYFENQKGRFDSLNEVTNGGDELIDLLVGDTDVVLYEKVEPKKLEKLAIFLYHTTEKSVSEIAKTIGYKSADSVKRLCDRTTEKIRERFFENGGFNND